MKKLLYIVATLLVIFSTTFIKIGNTSCFLEEFLVVYQGDWVFIPNNCDQDYYSIDVFQHPCVCNEDETECCGRWEIYALGGSDLIAAGLFCIKSTYEIFIKNDERTWEIPCITVRGVMSNTNPLDFGFVVDKPSTIEGRTFQLVRPH